VKDKIIQASNSNPDRINYTLVFFNKVTRSFSLA